MFSRSNSFLEVGAGLEGWIPAVASVLNTRWNLRFEEEHLGIAAAPGPIWRWATLPSLPLPGMWLLRCWRRCPRWNWGGSLCKMYPGKMDMTWKSEKTRCKNDMFGYVRFWFLKLHDTFPLRWNEMACLPLRLTSQQTTKNAGTARHHHGMADQIMSGRMSSASAPAWMVHPGESHWFCFSKCRRGWRGWVTVQTVSELLGISWFGLPSGELT